MKLLGPLNSYLPYLLNRAGARIATAFGEEVRPLGASLQSWRVLAALRERDGRRMGDLSETTSIEVSTLTRLVDGMERKGLVARRPAPGDARAVALWLTAAGERLTARIVPLAERYEKVALAGFGRQETDVLKQALRRLYDNIGKLERPSRLSPSRALRSRRRASPP